ncbi:D-tyrosyl-tRNA(Tyr) deacylase [Micrococcales bacterium 31B]|nr:D-tyrosyl-tRNA(Tyr) deacylase [Micrococcales bacterium 31B]
MRAVVQRATEASVSVDGAVVGAVRGVPVGTVGTVGTDDTTVTPQALCVLLGATHDDGPTEVAWMARKIAELRILRGEVSAQDVAAPVLLISQFTLYADTRKGRRPSWNGAAPGPLAEPLVEAVAGALRERGLPVETGIFGADMQVSLVNDGPVTIMLDSAAP